MNSLRICVRFGVAWLAAASVALVTTSGFAASTPRCDGVWSVPVTTTKGDCIASYRCPMRIEHGVLANDGDIAINVSGRVAANGSLKVALSHGETRALGQGGLEANAGAGSWKTDSCSGSWTAERRS
jgi:hypothetical protein